MTSFNASQSVVEIPHALKQSPRPASTTDPVEKSIESFAKDSDSNTVNQDIKDYLTEAYQIIKQAEYNQRDSPSYSYACYKQAIIIMLSITKGFNNKNLGKFSAQEKPSHLFGKLLDYYSLQDTSSKYICMGVFHVARDMIENTSSNAKSVCTNHSCMAMGCLKDETIRNEILKKFLEKDLELNSQDKALSDNLQLFFNKGLGYVLNDCPQPPAPHTEPRPDSSTKLPAPPAPAPPAPAQAQPQTQQAPTRTQTQQLKEPVGTPEERDSWGAAICNTINGILSYIAGLLSNLTESRQQEVPT